MLNPHALVKMHYGVASEFCYTFSLAYYWKDIAYLTSIIFQYTLEKQLSSFVLIILEIFLLEVNFNLIFEETLI